jgi:hypothetical protein
MKTTSPISEEAQEQQQITDIVTELEILSLRTSTLIRELKQLRQKRGHTDRTKSRNKEHDHDLKEGEHVVIKNTYLGKKGTEGTISYTTKTQVTLQDESGTFHTRKFTNVERVKKSKNECRQ